eukprot:3941072-Rhodomonas_salina.1
MPQIAVLRLNTISAKNAHCNADTARHASPRRSFPFPVRLEVIRPYNGGAGTVGPPQTSLSLLLRWTFDHDSYYLCLYDGTSTVSVVVHAPQGWGAAYKCARRHGKA